MERAPWTQHQQLRPPAAGQCDDWRLGQCRALGRVTGAGPAQGADSDRTLQSARPELLQGPPAPALQPTGRGGIVPPREKKVSLFLGGLSTLRLNATGSATAIGGLRLFII